jgi:hypothetical protein
MSQKREFLGVMLHPTGLKLEAFAKDFDALKLGKIYNRKKQLN